MPPPTLMIPNIKGGGLFTVHKLLNGTTLDPTQDGSNITDTKLSLAGTQEIRNPMIEAFGKRFLVSIGGIRERDQGGDGAYGVVFTAPVDIEQSEFFTGLHMAFPAGVPTMCWAYVDTGGDYHVVRTTDGVNFTNTEFANDTVAAVHHGRAFVFGDLFFWNVSEGSDTGETLRAFNLANDTTTSWVASPFTPGLNINVSSAPTRDFAVLNDTLYMLAPTLGSGTYLLRLDGLTWVNVFGGGAFIDGDFVGSAARSILFPDGENLVAFVPGATGVTPTVWHILDPGFGGSPSLVNTTAAVNASVLFLATTNGWAFSKYLDTTTPASPVLYFWAQAGGINGGTYDCYQWNGTGAPITLVGTGVVGANYILPNDIIGGQDRIPATPAARPQFDGLPQQVLGGRRRQFRVYGSGADVTLQQAHSADQQAPSVVSTLVASSIQLVDPIDVTGLVGNASETTLEGLTPASGDAYVLTVLDGDRILNPGGLTGLIPGDIVQYNGSAWVLAKQVVNVDYRLEGYWKFDGDGTDRTGNGRDFTLFGTVPFATGLIAQAADLPGTTGNYWARSTNDTVFDMGLGDLPFTLSVWVNLDSLPGTNGHIVSRKGLSGSGWELYVNSSGDARFQAGAGVDLTGAGLLSTSAGWQHLVFVSHGGDSTELYVDGVSVDTDTGGWTAGNPLNVGRDPSSNSLYLDGQVDELAIWSRALSSTEITALYNSGNGFELGKPDLGTHATLNSTTALTAPYTDGVDDGKTVSFAGRSLSGTVLNTPSNTAAQLTVTPDEGASRWSYIHDTGADSLPAGTKHTVLLDLV